MEMALPPAPYVPWEEAQKKLERRVRSWRWIANKHNLQCFSLGDAVAIGGNCGPAVCAFPISDSLFYTTN